MRPRVRIVLADPPFIFYNFLYISKFTRKNLCTPEDYVHLFFFLSHECFIVYTAVKK